MELPARIGPAEFSTLGAMVAVRCPSNLGPLIRNLHRATDPLFRRAGMDLDQEKP
jgi:hypothetical protein